jgi:hypothetical protein
MASESRPPASSKSTGNEGSRGSRGMANSGAQSGNSTNQGGDRQPESEGEPDLRGTDARGGGGMSSNSSRATDKDPGKSRSKP